MPLNANDVKNAQPKDKDYKLSDEKGLYLLVAKTGAKYWRLKYRVNGKEKKLGLGVYPEITLTIARKRRDEARMAIQDGIDPSNQRKATKQAGKDAAANSFEVVALEWFEKRGAKSEGGDKRTKRLMEKDLFPDLGRLAVNEITAPILLAALRKVEARGAIETAHRAKQLAGQVFRYAISTGRSESDPSISLKGALATPVRTHFAAITDPAEVGQLYIAVNNYKGRSTPTVAAALKLSALLFCRQGTLRKLTWNEINWTQERLEMNADQMKTGEQHIIPLSRQALAIFKDLRDNHKRGIYVFPNARDKDRPMSDNATRSALRSLGYDNDTMTPHGFRATARTNLDENLDYRVDLIEQQLAHKVKDFYGRAYNRTKHLDTRKEMMQVWADYLDQLALEAQGGNAV